MPQFVTSRNDYLRSISQQTSVTVHSAYVHSAYVQYMI